MNALVGYGSSDDEEAAPQSERPAKIARIDVASTTAADANATPVSRPEPSPAPIRAVASAATVDSDEHQGLTSGPSMPLKTSPPTHEATDLAPPSPYTFERQRLRDLTMPTVPNFDIPPSPPPPTPNSENAAALAATTKKFERFLELKKQGVHFNQRLQSSAALRNPSLLPKLMAFAGISSKDSYASTLPPELGVPVEWPQECYVENLIKVSERRGKKRLAERDKVEFVTATAGKSESLGTKSVTGKGPTGGGLDSRKSRFDKRKTASAVDPLEFSDMSMKGEIVHVHA